MKKASEGRYILKREGARKLLPTVAKTDNKASRGRSLLLAGSQQYPGAGVLAAKAALRMGSGYVMLAPAKSVISSLENPDFLVRDADEINFNELTFNAVLCGPGFGVNEFTAKCIRELVRVQMPAVVVDADAITVCAQYKLFPLPKTWIITPHTGELSRCLGISSEEINKNRRKAVRQAQKLTGCLVLLKGDRTLIASARRIYEISSGNAALAKSGTGDVLAGMITALMAQGQSSLRSVLLAAYIHGACANYWKSQRKDLLSMMASDVIELLPTVIAKLRRGPLEKNT